MNGIMDTLVWIANLPASHGYAVVFVAAFSAFGLVANAFGSRGRATASRLQQVRAARGMAADDGSTSRPDLIGGLSRWFFRVLALVVLASGVIALISLIGGPVTASYIYEHGVSTKAESTDSDYVRFTAEDGKTYTLHHNFFTPQSYPDDELLAFADQVVVRYLPGHPQAYVLDTNASFDAFGDPLGD